MLVLLPHCVTYPQTGIVTSDSAYAPLALCGQHGMWKLYNEESNQQHITFQNSAQEYIGSRVFRLPLKTHSKENSVLGVFYMFMCKLVGVRVSKELSAANAPTLRGEFE